MEHTSKSPHVQMLMKGGSSSSHSSHPANVLMKGHSRQHHFAGGISNEAPVYAKGGRTHKRFATGGHCYAEGGEAEKEYGEKPLTGQLRRGGRAKREHHYAGQDVIGKIPLVGRMAKAISQKVGTFDENKYGGSKYRQNPHAGAPVADNSVRQEQKNGGRSKRSHHYWGQDVIGRIPLVGGLANNIANTVGTLDHNKYGGANYTANTTGRKIADIASTIGNLGTNLLMAKGSSKKAKGGGVHHKHRHHHAEGGSGKVRKGMMTESGHMIHNDR